MSYDGHFSQKQLATVGNDVISTADGYHCSSVRLAI